MRPIKVLAIAPYTQLSDAIMTAVQSHPNISLKIYIGNLEQSLENYVQYSAWHQDVIISRGGTAAMLRERLNLPVIEIETSPLDTLRAIKLAQQTGLKFAVICFHSIFADCKMLSQLLQIDTETYEYERAEELPFLLDTLKQKDVKLVVGDVAAVNAARFSGLQSILITSSTTSIENTLKKVDDFFADFLNISTRERLFRSVLDCSSRGILVTDPNGKVLFSNEAFAKFNLPTATNTFQDLIDSFPLNCNYMQRQRAVHDSNFIIHINRSETPDPHFIFFVHRQLKTSSVSSCIEYESPQKTRAGAVFTGGSLMPSLMSYIDQACQSRCPVLLTGKPGTEKSIIARYIHCNSVADSGPFVVIRSSALTQKEWHLLVNNENSIFFSPSGSVFFENIHLLPVTMQNIVSKTLTDLALQNRIRLMASSTNDLAKYTSEGVFSRSLYALLNGYCIHTSELCHRKSEIPALAAVYISKYNAELNREIIGLEPEALELLINFRWPMNIDQLKSVMQQLILNAKGYYITAEEVNSILQRELKHETVESSFNLQQPLEDIERDIILHILKEENMNQSSAAKRLGISRSTLWRKIKES